MDLKTIADAVVAANRNHTEAQLLTNYYASDAVSVEAFTPDGGDREARGIDAIRAKHAWWNETFEMTGGTTSDAMLHPDDRFAIIFEASGRDRKSGESFEMKEIGLYTVKDGKIVREEFFYSM